jgi:protein-S-isoprenylcysteine O-methyltransferase Ste14
MYRSRLLLPPTIAIVAVISMIVLHVVAPIVAIVRAPLTYAGILLVLTGTMMIVWSRRAFQTARTSIIPFTESTTLVRHGLYRWSRNPMYLGAVLLVSGIAIVLGSLSPLFVVMAFFAILDAGFVRREERLLEASFGDQYRAYQRSVRRWL